MKNASDDTPSAMFGAFTLRPRTRHQIDGEVELGRLRLDVVEARQRDPGLMELVIELADRDTGELTTAHVTLPYDGSNPSPAARAMSLRAALLGWFEHELDELIYVNGERHRDPHEPPQFALKVTL